ncbi:MAG: hypothetical protein EAZ55_13515 [Cytophagales bacterium]|nr:MAG: hypothetical protein EAZ55_13515 [Cytophagales bacterium]
MMRNNKIKYLNKLGVLFIVFMFSSCFVFGQSKSPNSEAIVLESKIRLYCFQEVEYASLKISYKNISKDTLYLWTQNWRVHYLNEQDSSMFKDCPYDINAGFLNAVIFYKSVSAFYEKAVRFDYFNAGDTILNCSFVKKLYPEETFHTNIIFSDSSFISYLKKYKPSRIILHYSYANHFKPDIELQDSFYYKDDELIINFEKNPDSVNCETNNVVSVNGIQKKSHGDKFQAVFKPGRRGLILGW